jgi:carboxyl-terminal processing protease
MPLLLSHISLVLGASMLIIVVAATACGDGESGTAAGQRPTVAGELPSELAKVDEAYHALRERFVDREKFSEAAVRAIVDSLDDRFTTYFTAERFRMTQENFRGTFEGIGANVTVRDGRVTIVAPLPDSPAQRAGIMPADVILEVDGESVEGLSLGMVIDRIRGPEGEPVRIRIERAETGEVIDVTVVREGIRHITVTFELVADRVARVQITQFLATTVDDLKRVLDEVLDLGVAGVVLDLRNNPGGLVTSVVGVASQFLSQGLVLFQIDADGERTEWRVTGGGKAREIPLVVLVNEGSASASEVLAGALQDQGRASIIGTQTFGKGVVTIPVQFSDGSGLSITSARWFTPKGRTIGDVGITPNIEVPRTVDQIAEGQDPQLEAALEVLAGLIGADDGVTGKFLSYQKHSAYV